jgi:hypothetical protein
MDAAFSQRRSMVITWLNRRTLHLVRSENYWWLHSLTNPQLLTGNTRRLALAGVPPDDAERAVAVIRAALETGGPLIRAGLRDRIAAAGVRTDGQAIVYLLELASIRGLIIRGPMAGREQDFVLVCDWPGAPPRPVPRDTALAELARCYLAGHAPAARCLRSAAAGLGFSRPDRRTAQADHHQQRGVPAVRAGCRACRRHLEHARRPGVAGAVRAAGPGDRVGPGERSRRRRPVPGRLAPGR